MARPRDPTIDQRVLDAVVDLLGDGGYAELTMEAVAERAGVSRPSLYRRWPTLAHLVFAARARAGSPVPVPDTGCFAGDLRALLATFAEVAVSTDRALLADQFGTMIVDGSFARDAHVGLVEPLDDRARAVYERALARGEVRDDVDVSEIVRDLAGALLVRIVVAHDPPDRPTIDGMVDRAVHGLVRRPPGDDSPDPSG